MQLMAREHTFERKEETRRKIALGGLIVKAQLNDFTSTEILGLLLEAKERFQAEPSLATFWKMKGAQAFENDE